MTNQNSSVNNQENERIIIYKRLIQRKDKILEVTCEIEDLRKRYINQHQEDNDGSIESEIYKRLFIIVECLSELVGYTEGRSNSLFLTQLNYVSNSRRFAGSKFSRMNASSEPQQYDHIAISPVLDAICASVNAPIITWNFKNRPIVNIGNLESFIQLFKLPKA
jgi:hypothetical protein